MCVCVCWLGRGVVAQCGVEFPGSGAYPFYLYLQKFRKEDKQLSGTEAFMRRSDSLQRVSYYLLFFFFFKRDLTS